MSGLLKMLAPLAEPVGLVWLLLLALTVRHLRRGRWGAAAGFLVAAAIPWLLSQPAVLVPLGAPLERPWTEHTVHEAGSADAVVVLGGGWRSSPSDFSGIDLLPSADRWICGMELLRQGKARVLAVGGDVPNSPDPLPRSARLRLWLSSWGPEGAEILTLGPVLSTRAEAESTRELAARHGWKKILLVTSALHMRRSMALFEQLGIEVEPVACDFQFARHHPAGRRWQPFPEAEPLMAFGLWWHEQVGWIAYRLLGYA